MLVLSNGGGDFFRWVAEGYAEPVTESGVTSRGFLPRGNEKGPPEWFRRALTSTRTNSTQFHSTPAMDPVSWYWTCIRKALERVWGVCIPPPIFMYSRSWGR